MDVSYGNLGLSSSKEYDKTPTFRQCRIRHTKQCKFITGALLASGQLVLFKLGFNKNSIAGIKVVEGSYINDLITKDEEFLLENPNDSAKKMPYPFCYSFYICKPYYYEEKEDAISKCVFAVAHFSGRLCILKIQKTIT